MSDQREKTRFAIDIPKNSADSMADAGISSREKRGLKMPKQFVGPVARALVNQTGQISKEKREAPTESIAKEYADKGGK